MAKKRRWEIGSEERSPWGYARINWSLHYPIFVVGRNLLNPGEMPILDFSYLRMSRPDAFPPARSLTAC